jgi:beta-lactamase regulating signal transducer with metallopeptidase domain
MDFFYAFTETILHSIWQAGLLVLLFFCFTVFFKNVHPINKRNLLYGLLAIQIIVSTVTFNMYFKGNTINIFHFTTNDFVNTNWLSNNATLLFSIYTTLLSFRLMALLWKWNSFKTNYSRYLIKPSVEYKVFTELRAYQLGIKRKVKLWYSNSINAPITFGFLKPMIILPFCLLSNLTQTEVEAIILHELSHIKHKDYLLNWALVAIDLIYYFNPFIKILVENIKLEREKNCDLQVINFKYDKIQYAQILLKIAKNVSKVESFQIGAVSNNNQLLKRVNFFCGVDLQIKKNKTSIYALAIICLFSISLTMFFTQIQSTKKANTTFNKYSVATMQADNVIAKPEGQLVIKTIATVSKSTKVTKEKSKAKIETFPAIIIDVNEAENNSTYNFVAMNETDSIKEFIYTIETQKGEVTRSYILKQVKGKWVFLPKWMIKEVNSDSLLLQSLDTTFIKIDSVQ